MDETPLQPDRQASTRRDHDIAPPGITIAHHPSSSPPSLSDSAVRNALPAGLVNHPRYEVLALLGAGGMGWVYKARHRLMDRLVALKVIHPDLVGDPETLTRFRREVRAAAQLNHPSIVAAYDAEEAGGSHFLVMEYVPGTSLDRLLAEHGPLPVAEACGYARQVAVGLQHAFARGMVHRDVKPQNLMVTHSGQVKILDFGLARFVSETVLPEVNLAAWAGGEAAGRGEELTPSDAVLGSADYLAPEEAEDPRAADIRADIYSLGCTLYHLLTGRVPFPGGTFGDKLDGHRSQAPEPVARFRPDVPARVVETLARMMAKSPQRRFRTPAEVASALAPFTATRSQRVLVVDDDETVRRCLATILEAEGYTVGEAANGEEALAWLQEGNKPGLILLDLAMPVMDGLEFLQRLRADPRLVSIPVVIVSGTGSADARAAIGAADYLSKPIRVDELTDRIHRHVEAV